MAEKRTCTRCLLTETTPGISFDADGVCNYCATYESKLNVQGEDKLLELLRTYKEKTKDKKYDCMVGLSGGRDSTYTLYKLVKDYGMRVLCIHYDNPFTSPQAVENMRRASEALGVEVVGWGFPQGEHVRATKKALRIWARRPSSALIPIVCAHCKNWWPTIFKIARKNDISLIVIGSNPLETASFKKAAFGGSRTYHKLTNIPRIIGRTAKELAANPRYLTLSWPLILSMYLGASHSSPYLRKRYKDIQVIRLFDYLPWNEREVEDKAKAFLGWERSPEVESSWRFDCRLDYVRRKMYAATVGVTELRDLFSKMIREGMMTREEAAARLEKEDRVDPAVIEDVLRQVDMKSDDLPLG
ncbi:MAG: ATPase [Acidobacteriota bacterium]